MSVFRRNISLLRRYAPALLEKLCNPNKDDLLLFYAKNGQYSLKYKGQLLCSMYNPGVEAKRLLEEVDERKTDFLIILGMGLLYHVEEALKKSGIKKIYVVEKEAQIFSMCAKVIEFSPYILSGRVKFFVDEEKGRIKEEFLEDFSFLEYKGLSILKHPSVSLFHEYYREIEEKIKEAVDSLATQGATIKKFARKWQENIISSIPYLKSAGVKELFGKFYNIPALLISAGPSLDESVKKLHPLLKKALFVCVDTAYPTLHQHDIEPHIIVCLDPQETKLKYIENASSFIICSPLSPPEIFNIKAPKFLYLTDHPLCIWLSKVFGEKGTLDTSSGSVAGVALDLLLKMGCNPIVFVAQDLCYKNLLDHTLSYYKDWEITKFNTLETMLYRARKEKKTFFVDGNFGKKVLTDLSFNRIRIYIEERIRKSGRIFFNATEEGAKIEGTHPIKIQVLPSLFKEDYNVEATLLSIHKEDVFEEEKVVEAIMELINKLNEGKDEEGVLKVLTYGLCLEGKKMEEAYWEACVFTSNVMKNIIRKIGG